MIQRFLYSTLGLLVAIMATGGASYAQEPEVRGTLSKESIEVGDQFDYTLDVIVDRATRWEPPVYGPDTEQAKRRAEAKRQMSTFTEYNDEVIEVIDQDSPIDTVKIEGRRLHLRKRYRFAAMETGEIPFVPVIAYFQKNRDEADTLFGTDTLRLKVKSYEELDTTLFMAFDPTTGSIDVDSLAARKRLRDTALYTQKDLPFIFAEIRDYVIFGAIGLIILGLIIWLLAWLIARYISRRNATPRPAPKIPPHVVANKALIELGHRKLWQKGKTKAYYTALTSILRTYIDGRWGIGAMEMTTDEIIIALRDVEMPTASRTHLIEILRTADFVKFAKAEPEGEVNEEAMNQALYFVENTKPESTQRYEGKQEVTIETNIND